MNKIKSAIAGVLVVLSFTGTGCKQFKCVKGSGVVVDRRVEIKEPFIGIKSEADLEIELIQDTLNEASLTIRTDDNLLSYVQYWVDENQDLILKLNAERCVRPTHGIRMYVRNDVFKNIRLLRSGEIRSDSILNQKIMTISLEGSGKIVFNKLNCENLSTELLGSSSIVVRGEGISATHSVLGVGNIDASAFSTNFTTANIKGTGDIHTWVINKLTASIDGTGVITYSSSEDPTIEFSINGEGQVRAR